jgi:hypothetical protein
MYPCTWVPGVGDQSLVRWSHFPPFGRSLRINYLAVAYFLDLYSRTEAPNTHTYTYIPLIPSLGASGSREVPTNRIRIPRRLDEDN